ncbi:MAG: SapC family protein, partial [Burkholderiales bacterium]|nr:SapC family protein [Burkholderiales bacterium]
DYLCRNIDLLSEFQGHMRRTREFTQRLKAAGLLKEITLQVVPEGTEPLALQGLQIVDEVKLMTLEDAKLLELFRLGELGWVYAHLASLRNVQRLSRRLNRRLAKAA